jgi:hypothetical protein
MGTQKITRREVSFYLVQPKKGDKIKFRKLSEARQHARGLTKLGEFKSLKNSNGTVLPI